MNPFEETPPAMTLREYMSRNSRYQETSSEMTLGEYMRGQRYMDTPTFIEESPLTIYEKYYKHRPCSWEQSLWICEYQKLYCDDDDEEDGDDDYNDISSSNPNNFNNYLPIQKDEDLTRNTPVLDDDYETDDGLEEPVYLYRIKME